MLSFFLAEDLPTISKIINGFFQNEIHKYYICNTSVFHKKIYPLIFRILEAILQFCLLFDLHTDIQKNDSQCETY